MEYFDKEELTGGDDGLTVNESSASQKINEVISSEPEKPTEIPALTVEISNKSVVNHLKPQENKYWHFSFKNEENKNQLTQTLQNIPGYDRLTVEYGLPQNTADITLKMNDDVVGKIHLLLCDRRDANLPERYYCKIYFYHFKNQELFDAVKTAVVNFFENFKSGENKQGGKRNKPHRKVKTHKKKRINRRKKTSKRN